MSAIPVLGRLSQQNRYEFEGNLGNMVNIGKPGLQFKTLLEKKNK